VAIFGTICLCKDDSSFHSKFSFVIIISLDDCHIPEASKKSDILVIDVIQLNHKYGIAYE